MSVPSDIADIKGYVTLHFRCGHLFHEPTDDQKEVNSTEPLPFICPNCFIDKAVNDRQPQSRLQTILNRKKGIVVAPSTQSKLLRPDEYAKAVKNHLEGCNCQACTQLRWVAINSVTPEPDPELMPHGQTVPRDDLLLPGVIEPPDEQPAPQVVTGQEVRRPRNLYKYENAIVGFISVLASFVFCLVIITHSPDVKFTNFTFSMDTPHQVLLFLGFVSTAVGSFYVFHTIFYASINSEHL